jgi:hypothetical protein
MALGFTCGLFFGAEGAQTLPRSDRLAMALAPGVRLGRGCNWRRRRCNWEGVAPPV